MGIVSRLFPQKQSLPWTDDSIFNAIRTRIEPISGMLVTRELRLPDDESLNLHRRTVFAAGALDGIFGHHGGSDTNEAAADKISKLLDRVARKGDSAAAVQCYVLLKDDSVLVTIDAVVRQLAEKQTPIEPLRALALQLATRSRDRGPTKVGIALLGATKSSEHQDVVTVLGKHDEFTLYSAVALRNMLSDPVLPLWDLARHVDGWGRIQIVERLGPTENADVQRWLRTEGYKNSILYEYLALTAATHGRLLEALERETLPEEELVSASEIIQAMIAADRGPAAGMDHYGDAAQTCRAFLRHAADANPDLRCLLAAHAILRYVEQDKRDAAERLKCGWNAALTAAIQSQAREFVGRIAWASLVQSQLEAENDEAFYRANQCAVEMGLDTFDWHWRRLQSNSTKAGHWYYVMQMANEDRIDSIVSYAEEVLPLDAIATGSDDELGFGKQFEPHSCLGFVLQGLKRFPGKGRPLIVAGLRSPVVNNRNMAIGALAAWDQSQLVDLRDALSRAQREEVDEKLRNRIESVLAAS